MEKYFLAWLMVVIVRMLCESVARGWRGREGGRVWGMMMVMIVRVGCRGDWRWWMMMIYGEVGDGEEAVVSSVLKLPWLSFSCDEMVIWWWGQEGGVGFQHEGFFLSLDFFSPMSSSFSSTSSNNPTPNKSLWKYYFS